MPASNAFRAFRLLCKTSLRTNSYGRRKRIIGAFELREIRKAFLLELQRVVAVENAAAGPPRFNRQQPRPLSASTEKGHPARVHIESFQNRDRIAVVGGFGPARGERFTFQFLYGSNGGMNDEPMFGSRRPGADDRQRRRVLGGQSRKHRLGSAENDIDLSG